MKKILVLLLIGLFFSPIFVSALDQPTDGDPTYDFDRVVFAKNNAMVEIAFSDEGEGVYLVFECDVELNMHIINSSARMAVLQHQAWDSVNDMNLLFRTDGSLKFILPYDDTFYILFNNDQNEDSNLDGWYAADKTGPQIILTGISDGQGVDYTDNIEVFCYFEEPYWNLTKMEVLYGIGYSLRTMEVNQKLYNLSVWIDFSVFGESSVDLIFKGTDTFGNVRELPITVVIFNLPITTTTPTGDGGTFMFMVVVGVVGLFGVAAIISSANTYRREGVEGLRPKGSVTKRQKKQRKKK